MPQLGFVFQVNSVTVVDTVLVYLLLRLNVKVIYICDATETGGTPPVTTTNETTPPPWRRQAALGCDLTKLSSYP